MPYSTASHSSFRCPEPCWGSQEKEAFLAAATDQSTHQAKLTKAAREALGSLAYLLAPFSTARFPPLRRFHGCSGFGRMDQNDKKDGVMKHSSSVLAEGLETGHTREDRHRATTWFEPTETTAKRINLKLIIQLMKQRCCW